MTTDRKPMSGRSQTRNDLHKYNENSRKQSTGRFMRTFSRTKTSHLITSWDDVHFFSVKGSHIKAIVDATGNVDSATVGEPVMLALLEVLWNTHYENANLKDLVTADRDAWLKYFCCMFQICIDIQIQYNFRTYLPAYTESDTVSGAAASISYWSQSSYDIFVASMKEFPVPKLIYTLVDLFCTWVVKLTSEYERYTLKIPAAIFCPFTSKYDLADLEALRALLRVNLGGMTTHAKKFGLKTGAWRDPVKPVEKFVSDPDVIAYFCHSKFQIYDNTPASFLVELNGGFKGANLTTDYTAHEYFFKDTPNESMIHLLAPWFGTYDATNNPYGGVIHNGSVNTAEYYVDIVFTSQHGTTMTAANFGDAVITDMLIGLYKAAWDNFAATFSIQFNGTNFTAIRGLDDTWPLAMTNLLFLGKGRGATETNNDIISGLGPLLK